MRESRTYGSVRGALSNGRPYRDPEARFVSSSHIGKAGWQDWNVARYASDGDFVLVTNNASDFRRLYAMQLLHAGLVIIVPSVNRIDQQRLFQGALDELGRSGEPVNQVLEVETDGEDVIFSLYDLPASPP